VISPNTGSAQPVGCIGRGRARAPAQPSSKVRVLSPPRSSPDTTGSYAYAGHPFSPNNGRKRSLAVPISFDLWPAPGFGGLR